MRIWDTYISERDRAVYEASGYGARGGFGKRPAVVIVDVNYAFTGDRNVPIMESIKTWRNSCGEAGWAAIPPTQRLLAAARDRQIPVFYTTGTEARPDQFERGSWLHKNKRAAEDKTSPVKSVDGRTIVNEIAPLPHEIVINKLKPSAFVGTPLTNFLIDLGVDSLIVTGTTTSGCVRGTVIDAFSANYKVTVVEECCFDRFDVSHAVNLFDMNAKYADVIGIDETVEYLETVPRGLFADKIAFPERVPALH